MEDFMDEFFPLDLPNFITIPATLVPTHLPDLGDWNIEMYYEAMGFDFEEPEKENDDQ